MTLKHAAMTLYSEQMSINSLRVRLALAEKGTLVNIIYIDESRTLPEKLEQSIGKDNLPILVDRELTLFNPEIIGEYLDERFPHPPLLPVYPVVRAKCRLLIKYFENQIYPMVRKLELCEENKKTVEEDVLNSLSGIIELLDDGECLMGDGFSLVDCCFIPLLLFPKVYKLLLKKRWEKLDKYMSRVFARASFLESLSELEREKFYELQKL